jgi:hypothetical protein
MDDDEDDELTGITSSRAGDTPPTAVPDAPDAPAIDVVREDMVVNAVAFLKHPQVRRERCVLLSFFLTLSTTLPSSLRPSPRPPS